MELFEISDKYEISLRGFEGMANTQLQFHLQPALNLHLLISILQ